MLQVPPSDQISHPVGFTGLRYEDGYDELGHSVAPIITEKLAGLSIIRHADCNVSDQETDSNPDSGELSDSEYGGDPIDSDEKDPDDFVEEVYAIVEEALQTGHLDTVVERIDSLRDSYDIPNCDTAEHLLYKMTKLALETHHSEEVFNKHIEKMFSNWKDILKYFTNDKYHELRFIHQVQMICSEITTTPFSPFSKILTCLYDNGIVHKHAILFWAHSGGWDSESEDTYDALVNQSNELIKRLEEEPYNCVVPENFFHPEIEEEKVFQKTSFTLRSRRKRCSWRRRLIILH